MPNYTQERVRPAIPACARARLSLVFDGVFLRGVGSKEPIVHVAVSGKPNDKGSFDYSPERQKVAFQGPIPEGEYWIRLAELWENNWFKSAIRSPRSAWGNFRLAIHPLPATQTHGRGGFFIHGGDVPGSAGCIDLTLHMDRFIEQLRRELGDSTDCYVPLNVRYARK